jgi:hypothetical protein
MGAQHDFIVNVEGVLRVPGRVVLGQIQSSKLSGQTPPPAFDHGKAMPVKMDSS